MSKRKGSSSTGWFLLEVLLLGMVAAIMVLWLFTTGNGVGGPDEPMRYDMVKWFVAHPGKLPVGDDPELLNKTWGLSYAFYPYLAYMITAVFAGLAKALGGSADTMLYVSRMVSAAYLLIASVFVMKAGKKLFGREKGILFSVLVIFLPGFHFLGTYVNNDSFALMASAIIFYAWASVLEEGWSWKNCIHLAIGMGLCLMSYYNAYGWVLMSFFFFVLTVMLCRPGRIGERLSFLITRGLVISVITLGLSAWFFVRNFLLYDGDITGRNAATICAEKYAKQDYKPSVHWTPRGAGWTFRDLMRFQLVGWEHNWFILSLISFVGTFGTFTLFMEEGVSKAYLIFIFIGFLGLLLSLESFLWHRRESSKSKRPEKGKLVVTKVTRIEWAYDARGIMNCCMVGAMIIPVVIFSYYAYTIDLQAQGRYFITAVYAIMYFVVTGLSALLDRVFRSQRLKQIVYALIAIVWVTGAVFNYVTVVVPAYGM